MRILAISLNVIMLGVAVYFFATAEGSFDGDDWFIIIMWILTPLFSLTALICDKGDHWLSMYFKRKVLEEKQKIDQLSGTK